MLPLRFVAEALGCETLGMLDQTYFLMALAGLDDSGSPRLPDAPRARQTFKTLVMPGGLGSTMKVMIFGRNVGRPALTGLMGASRLT